MVPIVRVCAPGLFQPKGNQWGQPCGLSPSSLVIYWPTLLATVRVSKRLGQQILFKTSMTKLHATTVSTRFGSLTSTQWLKHDSIEFDPVSITVRPIQLINVFQLLLKSSSLRTHCGMNSTVGGAFHSLGSIALYPSCGYPLKTEMQRPPFSLKGISGVSLVVSRRHRSHPTGPLINLIEHLLTQMS